MKKCIKCNVELSLDNFHKSKASPDGHINTCKICKKEFNKKYSDTYKKETNTKYYLKNKEIIKIKQKIWSENNKDKKKEKNLEWAKNNPDKIRTSNRLASKKWRESNKEQDNINKAKYRKTIPHILAWRYCLKSCLLRLGQKKEGHTHDLLGYSAIELKEHITTLFTDGMSWDNYGEWHIDHIKKVCEFDKETPMNIVNTLPNLRPLWATTREINGVIYIGNLNRPKH